MNATDTQKITVTGELSDKLTVAALAYELANIALGKVNKARIKAEEVLDILLTKKKEAGILLNEEIRREAIRRSHTE